MKMTQPYYSHHQVYIHSSPLKLDEEVNHDLMNAANYLIVTECP